MERKLLGEILQEAALISSGQVQVALMEQLNYNNLKIGEILVLHGWIQPETINFFVNTFPKLINNPIRKKIGNYLFEAGLINKNQAEEIIKEQFKSGGQFGFIAVMKGFIKLETLDFFWRHFFPDKLVNTDFNNLAIERKPLGEILQEAALISSGQVQVALIEQLNYDNLKIGEILALHGWITEKTVNFFADSFPRLIKNPIRKKIGNYLCEAGLLNENQVQEIIKEQIKSGVKFGSLAVTKGLIKQETLNFFLQYFFPEQMGKTALPYLDGIDYLH